MRKISMFPFKLNFVSITEQEEEAEPARPVLTDGVLWHNWPGSVPTTEWDTTILLLPCRHCSLPPTTTTSPAPTMLYFRTNILQSRNIKILSVYGPKWQCGRIWFYFILVLTKIFENPEDVQGSFFTDWVKSENWSSKIINVCASLLIDLVIKFTSSYLQLRYKKYILDVVLGQQIIFLTNIMYYLFLTILIWTVLWSNER